jgi:hypothetical protein
LRTTLILFALGCPFWLFAQPELTGVVVDEASKNPISYVNIGVFDKNIGTVSDAKGVFSLNIGKIGPGDSIVFSVVGYRRVARPLRELLNTSPLIIPLREDVINLREIVIENDPSDIKTLGVNRVSGKKFGFIGGVGAGAEISRKMSVSKPSLLQSASIYVRNKISGPFKLRLNVYTIDRNANEPGHSLLTRSIILESDLKEGWLNYDFEEPLAVDEPFYISYEWVEANLQNPMIALRGNNHDEKVRIRPVSMGRWIMGGNYDFAIRCEVMND